MLTAEENELLTRIGQGTRMGEVLRRYWHPVGLFGVCHDQAAARQGAGRGAGALSRAERPAGVAAVALRPSQRRPRLWARRGRLHSLPLGALPEKRSNTSTKRIPDRFQSSFGLFRCNRMCKAALPAHRAARL
jgi:hypothetical protein